MSKAGSEAAQERHAEVEQSHLVADCWLDVAALVKMAEDEQPWRSMEMDLR